MTKCATADHTFRLVTIKSVDIETDDGVIRDFEYAMFCEKCGAVQHFSVSPTPVVNHEASTEAVLREIEAAEKP